MPTTNERRPCCSKQVSPATPIKPRVSTRHPILVRRRYPPLTVARAMSRDARGVRRCVTALTVVVITLTGVAPWIWRAFFADASDFAAARVRGQSVDSGSNLHSGGGSRRRFAEEGEGDGEGEGEGEGEGGGGGGAGCERDREDKVTMPLNELLSLVKASVSSGGNPGSDGARAALQLREVADALDPLYYPAKALPMNHEEKNISRSADTAVAVKEPTCQPCAASSPQQEDSSSDVIDPGGSPTSNGGGGQGGGEPERLKTPHPTGPFVDCHLYDHCERQAYITLDLFKLLKVPEVIYHCQGPDDDDATRNARTRGFVASEVLKILSKHAMQAAAAAAAGDRTAVVDVREEIVMRDLKLSQNVDDITALRDELEGVIAKPEAGGGVSRLNIICVSREGA